MLVPLLLISTNVLPSDIWQLAAGALCLHFMYYKLHMMISQCMVIWTFSGLAVLVKIYNYRLYSKSGKGFWSSLFCSNFNRFAEYWNGYELHGEDEESLLQRKERLVVLVGLNSRCAVDLAYISSRLNASIILPAALRVLPGVASLMEWVGCSWVRHEVTSRLSLQQPSVVVLQPGGHEEAYSEYNSRHKVNWSSDSEVLELLAPYYSAEVQDTICFIPFYTRNADLLFVNPATWYTVTGSLVQKNWPVGGCFEGSLWRQLNLTMMCLMSVGLFLIPRPVKMDTYFGPVIKIKDGEKAEDFAHRVRHSLQGLIDKADRLPKRRFQHQEGAFPVLVAGLYGLFITLQNVLLFPFVLVLCIGVEMLSHLLLLYKRDIRRKPAVSKNGN